MRFFFGNGGSETLNNLLQNLAKNFFFDSSNLTIGWGAPQLPTQAPKTLFWGKNGIFWRFWGKKCGFWVMAAPKQSITFFESSTLKIGWGALQLTTQAPNTLF